MTDIAGERRRLAAVGLVIEHREAWGATFNYAGPRDVDRPATRLFLHVAEVKQPAGVAAEREAVRLIERIGVERFPSTGFSYNAVVAPSGRLYEGQPLTRRGAHTLNDEQRTTCPTHHGSLTAPSWNLNVNSRAIVLPQHVADVVTDEQVDGIARWGAALILAGEVARGTRWCGHRCVSSKDCPGDHGFARIPEIQARTEFYVANGLDEDMATPEEIADAVYKKFLTTNVTAATGEADPQARSATLFELAIVATRRAYAAVLAGSDELLSYGGAVYLRSGLLLKPVPASSLATMTARHGAPRATDMSELGMLTNLNTVLAIQGDARRESNEQSVGIAGGILALQTKTDSLSAGLAGLATQVAGLDLDLSEADVHEVAAQLAAAVPPALAEALVTALGQRLAGNSTEGGPGAGQ